jgi:hypothetical protein
MSRVLDILNEQENLIFGPPTPADRLYPNPEMEWHSADYVNGSYLVYASGWYRKPMEGAKGDYLIRTSDEDDTTFGQKAARGAIGGAIGAAVAGPVGALVGGLIAGATNKATRRAITVYKKPG